MIAFNLFFCMNTNNTEPENEKDKIEEQYIFNLKEFQEAFEKFLKAIQNENKNINNQLEAERNQSKN